MKVPFPVAGNVPRRARHWLIGGVVLGRREPWSRDHCFAPVIPKPFLARLEALDHCVAELSRVPGGVLTRRAIAASDVATEGTTAQVEPPPPIL